MDGSPTLGHRLSTSIRASPSTSSCMMTTSKPSRAVDTTPANVTTPPAQRGWSCANLRNTWTGIRPTRNPSCSVLCCLMRGAQRPNTWTCVNRSLVPSDVGGFWTASPSPLGVTSILARETRIMLLIGSRNYQCPGRKVVLHSREQQP